MNPGDFLYSSDVFALVEDLPLIDDVGLVLPVIVAWFAIRVARLMQGGKFERVWKLIAAGMSVLAIIKVVDGLESLGVLQVAGLRSLLEFLMIVVFFLAFVFGYRSLQLAIRGPSLEKPEIAVPKSEKEETSEDKEETN